MSAHRLGSGAARDHATRWSAPPPHGARREGNPGTLRATSSPRCATWGAARFSRGAAQDYATCCRPRSVRDGEPRSARSAGAVVLTAGRSMHAALGVGSRPAGWRVGARKGSSRLARVPASRQHANASPLATRADSETRASARLRAAPPHEGIPTCGVGGGQARFQHDPLGVRQSRGRRLAGRRCLRQVCARLDESGRRSLAEK